MNTYVGLVPGLRRYALSQAGQTRIKRLNTIRDKRVVRNAFLIPNLLVMPQEIIVVRNVAFQLTIALAEATEIPDDRTGVLTDGSTYSMRAYSAGYNIEGCIRAMTTRLELLAVRSEYVGDSIASYAIVKPTVILGISNRQTRSSFKLQVPGIEMYDISVGQKPYGSYSCAIVLDDNIGSSSYGYRVEFNGFGLLLSKSLERLGNQMKALHRSLMSS